MKPILSTLAFLGCAYVVTSKVVSLDANNFDDMVGAVDVSIVKFYAPWCGHCKRLAPKYEAAATAMADLSVPFFEVDLSADQNRPLGNRFGVNSYPTMKIFRQTEMDEEASADLRKVARETAPLVNFMSELTGNESPEPPPVRQFKRADDPKDDPCAGDDADAYAEKHYGDCCGNGNWEKPQHLPVCRRLQEKRRQNTPLPEVHIEKAEESAVLVIKNTEDFDETAPRHHLMLMEWFAPWCGHCKTFAPIYRAASVPLRRYGVTLAKMDGTDPASTELKQRFGVVSFPTIKLLWWGEVDPRLSFAVSMVREEEHLLAFMKMVKDGTEPQMPDDPDLPPPMVRNKDDKDRRVPVLKRKVEPTTKEPSDSRVKQLTGTAQFEKAVSRASVALVEFYAPWCGHCKKLTPEYTKAAETLAGDRILLAKVDATDEANDELKNKFGISSFPTLKIFVNGDFSEDYGGGRTEADIVRTMRSKNDAADKCVGNVKYTLKNYRDCCNRETRNLPGHEKTCQAAKKRM